MKLKLLAITAMCLFSHKAISQVTDNVNPKSKFYFGAEIGRNTIQTLQSNILPVERTGGRQTFQMGILAEYYFEKHWSLSGRIKYFETGASFYQPYTPDKYAGTFNGSIITVPIDLKWEFRVFKNLGAGLKLGPAFTSEIKSKYTNYTSDLSTDLPRQYFAFNYGIGLNYFINKNLAAYVDYEGYTGQAKGHDDGGMFGVSYYYTQNQLLNFGVKYDFSNRLD